MNVPKATRRISIRELKTMLASGEKPLLLDVLPQARYQQKHIADAENTCVFEVNFLEQVAALGVAKSQPIVLYGCNDKTHDAKTAADKLLRDGYLQVSVLDGGLAAWQATGNPVEGDATAASELQTAGIKDGAYLIDSEASVIEWAGRNPNSTHRGSLRLSAGEVRIEAGQISGQFTIDMNSIENADLVGNELKPVLESHLKSDDFFFVKKFPQAHFEMTATETSAAQPVSSPNYTISGRLKLCGISAEQSFLATIVPSTDGKLAAEAHFDFDRTRWGVLYGSTRFFEHLGMHLVFDQISLQLRILTQ